MFTRSFSLQKLRSLDLLNDWVAQSELIAIIGGGPSLDYCETEIIHLIKKNCIFFLTDVVAEKFIKKHPESLRVVFSVEKRVHPYLSALRGEKIALYRYARFNMATLFINEIYSFLFDFDKAENRADLFQMKSPGTVSGAAIYWAVYLASLKPGAPKIFLMGLDLFFLENQIYNRYANLQIKNNYFDNRETREWEIMLKKSSIFKILGGVVLRTSEEFRRTRENLKILIESRADSIEIYDFSPLGVDSDSIKKIIPAKINDSSSAT